MTQLAPPAIVVKGEITFRALEASRDEGLHATVQAINGRVLCSDTVYFARKESRVAFAVQMDCLSGEEVHAALGDLHDQVEGRLRAQLAAGKARRNGGGGGENTYAVVGGRMCWNKPTMDGTTIPVPLANFAARIIEEVVTDDGAEQHGEFVIVGELIDGTPLPAARIPFGQFTAMKWIVGAWGNSAVPGAGNGTADRLREAIQLHSVHAKRRTEYTHTGWRLIGDRWHFLTATSAINEDGLATGIDVTLGRTLQRTALPEPPQGERLRAAIRASLAIADIAPDRISIPFLSGVYHAPLQEIAPTDSMLHLTGHTGTFKSEYATLGQQHFGAGFSRLTLPAQWASTANALERIAFEAKDIFLVIDDFAPSGTANEINRYHMTAERFVRSVGNGAGRSRMSADGRLRPDFPPRCLPCSTGEEIPRGQSIRARLSIEEIGPGDINAARLTTAQHAGIAGQYAEAMAGYVQWLAGRMERLKANAPADIARIRGEAHSLTAVHARTPEAVAHFFYSWECWLNFALDSEAITQGEYDAWARRVWAALQEMGRAQAAHQRAEDVPQRFLELVDTAITSGQAHLASPQGTVPEQNEEENPAPWGWRRHIVGTGDYQRPEWQPQGMRIGWVEGESVYLLPDAAYQIVNRIAMTNGTPLPITIKTLGKRLQEQNLLQETEKDGHTIRYTAEGRRQRVLHLNRAAFGPDEHKSGGELF